jgi:hypothetical protein
LLVFGGRIEKGQAEVRVHIVGQRGKELKKALADALRACPIPNRKNLSQPPPGLDGRGDNSNIILGGAGSRTASRWVVAIWRDPRGVW